MKAKRIGGLLLTLAMLLSLAPALGGSARAANPTKLYLGGEWVGPASSGYYEVVGDGVTEWGSISTADTGNNGSATYANGTLTLDGWAAGSNSYYYDPNSTGSLDAGIYCVGDLTLVLKGTNKFSPVNDPDADQYTGGSGDEYYGIYVDGNLTIKNAAGENASLYLGAYEEWAQVKAAGIYCTGKLTVEQQSGGTLAVTVVGSDIDPRNTEDGTDSYGVYARGGLALSSGTLNATGGAATGTGCSCGVYATTAVPRSTVEVTVSGGATLTATGGTVSGTGYSYGVYGAATVSGSTVEVITSGTLTATGGSAAQGSSSGLYAQKLTISGGTVNAVGGSGVKSRGADPSAFTMSGGTLNATGGAATGAGGSAGLEMPSGGSYYPISVTGGTINAAGGSVPGGAEGENGSYGILCISSSADSKLFLTTGGTVVAKGYTYAARPTSRIAAPTLLCGANYNGTGTKASSAVSMSDKYAELRTDQVGVAVTGWDYGTYNETKNGPFYCAAAGVTVAYIGRGGTNYNSATRPNNAGDYTVTATYGGKTASADFTISRRDLSYASANFGTQRTYSGDAQGVALNSVTCDGKTLVRDTDYTITGGDTATNVGLVSLTLAGKGNYTGTRSDYWTLQKKTPEKADFTIPAIAAQPYTGYPIDAIPAPALKGGRTGCGEITVRYNGSAERPTEPGSYIVTFDVAGGTNYVAATGLAYGTLTIEAASAVIDSGTVDGTQLSWRLAQDGTLTVSGKGAIPDYNKSTSGAASPTTADIPWQNYKKEQIKRLVVEPGVTRIGHRAFQNCYVMTSATIADSVESIGDYAFEHCQALNEITLGENVTLGQNPFNDSPAKSYVEALLSARESDAYTASPYFESLCSVALTENYRDNVIAIARSQAGYHEGDSEADYGGGNTAGTGDVTEYGRYLSSSGNAWCSEFATWCVRMAGVPTSLLANSRGANATTFTSGTSAHYYDWTETGWGGGAYTPQKGDVILWDWENESPFNAETDYKTSLSHTTLLMSAVDNGNGTITLHVVHGNSSGAVGERDFVVDKTTGKRTSGGGCVGYFVAPDYGGDVETHTVVFNANGGVTVTANKTVANGGLYGPLPIPTGKGVFLGWFTAPSGGRRVNMYSPVSLGENQTLYAQWGITAPPRIVSASVSGTTLTYTVTGAPANALLFVAWYDANGRMLGMTSTNVSEGNTTDATLTVTADADIYKLMLVDKTTFVPLCPAWSNP